jgi:hypothetical protein
MKQGWWTSCEVYYSILRWEGSMAVVCGTVDSVLDRKCSIAHSDSALRADTEVLNLRELCNIPSLSQLFYLRRASAPLGAGKDLTAQPGIRGVEVAYNTQDRER